MIISADFKKRMNVEVRGMVCNMAREMIKDGDVTEADLQFSLANPGDDPEFHALCQHIVEYIDEKMYEIVTANITGGF